MKDFFKYITAGEEDRNWGLYLNVVGKSIIEAHSTYPSREHPTGYYFTWKNGRILNEYQINYITEGSGMLETEQGRVMINPGTMMLIRPKVWHRYKPSVSQGWVENYIGFNGELVNHFIDKLHIPSDQSFIRCSICEEYIDTFYKIFNIVKEEKPGFQQVASGMIIKLLGYIITFHKQRHFSGNKIEQVIQEARFEMRENIDKKSDLQYLAAKNNIGYSYFRKLFKKYVGVSPHQYDIELKIIRARELILTTHKIANETATGNKRIEREKTTSGNKVYGLVDYNINSSANGIWLPSRNAVKDWSNYPCKQEYAKRAMEEHEYQFHLTHPMYSNSVKNQLKQIVKKIENRSKSCIANCDDSETDPIPAPKRLKNVLCKLSELLEQKKLKLRSGKKIEDDWATSSLSEGFKLPKK